MEICRLFTILILMYTSLIKSTTVTPFFRHDLVSMATTCHCKYQVIDDHSACIAPSDDVIHSGVSEEEQGEIVDEHNRVRSNVTNPTAANMQKMVWDDELAEVAQGWADQCERSHDGENARKIPGRFHTGQNIYYHSSVVKWTAAIQHWEAEKEDFIYGGENESKQVAHYTQIIWAESVKIGCGFAECSDASYYVCDYGPAGNVNDISTPYVSGTPCTGCGGECIDNYCDCQGLVCENYGEMINGSCSCDCYRNHHVGDSCSLDCSLAIDHHDCDSYKCSISNVPALCPWKCEECPTAGIGYNCDEAGGSTPGATPYKPWIFSISLLVIIKFV